MYTKDLMHADRCALFMVDHEKGEMYSDFIDEGTTDEQGRPVFVKSDRIRSIKNYKLITCFQATALINFSFSRIKFFIAFSVLN